MAAILTRVYDVPAHTRKPSSEGLWLLPSRFVAVSRRVVVVKIGALTS